uniref:Uncharacterized protein n=1 Tax=Anguilla anguilla TaxID=7936 RepID=A0A0E9V432_ANGAN
MLPFVTQLCKDFARMRETGRRGIRQAPKIRRNEFLK